MMHVEMKQPFKGYVSETCENFMISNPQNRKVRREDIIQ